MRVAAPGSSTPGTSAPKTVRGVRLNGLIPAQSPGTVVITMLAAAMRRKRHEAELPTQVT